MKDHITHPSYGQIGFSRTESTGQRFYGSELSQRSYVTLEIKESETYRSLNSDKYHPGKNIVRLRMSNAQFAELITSFNRGVGTPCTIERIKDEGYTLPEAESRKEVHSREFQERMEEFAKTNISTMNEILTLAKGLSVKRRGEIKRKLERINTEIASNIPFFADQFQEHMDTVVNDAKCEVEGYVEHKIRSAGLEAIKDQFQLEGENK